MMLSILKSELPFKRNMCIGFARYLAGKISVDIVTSAKKEQLTRWDALFLLMQNDNGVIDLSQLNHVDKQTLSQIKEGSTGVTLSTIIDASHSLVCADREEILTISIDASAKAKGFTKGTKLATVCELINYGTIDIKGYPVFTDCFREARENLNMYVSMYNWGLPIDYGMDITEGISTEGEEEEQ